MTRSIKLVLLIIQTVSAVAVQDIIKSWKTTFQAAQEVELFIFKLFIVIILTKYHEQLNVYRKPAYMICMQ